MNWSLVLERWQETCVSAIRVDLFGIPNTSEAA